MSLDANSKLDIRGTAVFIICVVVIVHPLHNRSKTGSALEIESPAYGLSIGQHTGTPGLYLRGTAFSPLRRTISFIMSSSVFFSASVICPKNSLSLRSAMAVIRGTSSSPARVSCSA